jgi:hypothetical protein
MISLSEIPWFVDISRVKVLFSVSADMLLQGRRRGEGLGVRVSGLPP